MTTAKTVKQGKLVTTKSDVHVNDVVTLVKLDGTETVENATVSFVSTYSTGGFNCTDASGATKTIKPLSAWAVVNFGKAGPEFWPPKPGDVWRTSTTTNYFIGDNCIVGSHITQGNKTSGIYPLTDLTELWQKYGYNVTLEYRKGVKEAAK